MTTILPKHDSKVPQGLRMQLINGVPSTYCKVVLVRYRSKAGGILL